MRILSFIIALLVLSAGISGTPIISMDVDMSKGPKYIQVTYSNLRRYIAGKSVPIYMSRQLKRLKRIVDKQEIKRYLKMMNGNVFTHSVKMGKGVQIKGRLWFKEYQALKKHKSLATRLGIVLVMLILAYSVHPMFSLGVCGAVINSNASGAWNVGGTWVGGVPPATTDDGIILNTHNVSLPADTLTGSLEVQVGGTITGGGFTLTCDDRNATAFGLLTNGVISGVLDIKLTLTTADQNTDFNGTSGNIRNLTIECGTRNLFGSNTIIDGNVTVTSGDYFDSNTTNTLTIGGNLIIDGTLGGVAWTGKLTIGGNMSGTGTYSHGNQEVEFNGASGNILNDFTFYDLTADGTDLFNRDAITTTVEHTLTINAGKTFYIWVNDNLGGLILGTATASGNIANAGTFNPHRNDGTANSFVQAANASHYANLEGAGVYDWDFGTSHGEVHWKWLNHKSTHVTSKTTGGGGVTIVLDDVCEFYEDWNVAVGDTFDADSNTVTFVKDVTNDGTLLNVTRTTLRVTGTGIIRGWTTADLEIQTDSAYSFDGTVTVGATGLAWKAGRTGDFLPYDATSILNVTGGITVPVATYFGADAGGDMGDGNPASGWTADMSWGWLANAGNSTLSTGITTWSSTGAGGASYCLRMTAGTFAPNSGTVTVAHNGQAFIYQSGGTGDFNNLIFDGGAATFSELSGMDVDGSLTLTNLNYVYLVSGTAIGVNVTVSDGLLREIIDAGTLTIGGNLSIASAGTFGHATWTGGATIGGNITMDGIYQHAVAHTLTLTGNFTQDSVGNTNTLSATTTIGGTITLDEGTLIDLRTTATQIITVNGGELQYGVTRTEESYSYIRSGGAVVINTGVVLVSIMCINNGVYIPNATPGTWVTTITGSWVVINPYGSRVPLDPPHDIGHYLDLEENI